MTSKSVLVSYLERKRVLKIPDEKTATDVEFLREKFRKEFNLESNVNIIFQRFDDEWSENIDLDDEAIINNKDKLTAMVVPILNTTKVSVLVDKVRLCYRSFA